MTSDPDAGSRLASGIMRAVAVPPSDGFSQGMVIGVGPDNGKGLADQQLAVVVAETLLSPVLYIASYLPAVGDQVLVAKMGNVRVVLGGFGTAVARTPVSAHVDADESTTSFDYTDLTTPGPAVTVNVTRTGSVLALFNSRVGWSDNTPSAADGAFVSLDVSGANIIAAGGFGFSAYFQLTGTTAAAGQFSGSGMKLYQGLNPGLTTFKMVYGSGFLGKTVDFSNRILTVFPY